MILAGRGQMHDVAVGMIRWDVQKRREHSVQQANGNAQTLFGFKRDPLLPPYLHVVDFGHVFRRTYRVEQLCTPTKLQNSINFDHHKSNSKERIPYIYESSPRCLCQLVCALVSDKQANNEIEEVDMDEGDHSELLRI